MKIFKISLMALLAVFFTACDKETADLSVSTYYVAFDIQGDNPLIVQVGGAFADPGCVATEQGVDVTSAKMVTNSNVDPSVMGLYQVEYSAVNKDGLKSRAVRDVIVCNPNVTTDISGEYYAAPGTQRIHTNGTITPYANTAHKCVITRLAPGFFSVSDFFSGYYDIRAKYGPNYAMTGFIALNPNNTIDLISSNIKGWGDGLDALRNGVYNPLLGTIYWEADYASAMTFYVTLTK
jgi:hypothetical protein